MKRTRSVLLLVFGMLAALLPMGALPAVAASPGDVVINEFEAKGTEWIELFNPGGSGIDISGWVLTDGEDDEPLSGTIAAGGYFAIDTTLELSNNGDEIRLFDSGSVLIDEVAYGDRGGAPLPPFGTSTARSPNGSDTGDFAADWNVDVTPTKGLENDGPGTNLGGSVVINEQNAFSPGGDFYELFNPTATSVDLTGWSASDGDDIVTISGTIAPSGFSTFTNLSISSVDVLYLWNSSGVRVDQLGRAGEFEDDTFQRIPDGVGPNDGYDFASSGGGSSYFDCVATRGTPNGEAGCSDDAPVPLTIPEIQGPGQYSPYENKLVVTTGIVTAVTANGRDMWIQDPQGDNDPETSDGVFVDDRDRLPDPQPVVGDLVRVTAEVDEQAFGTALPRTILNNPDDYPFMILSSGNTVPAAVVLADLPNEIIASGIEFWEPLEGMLVMAENSPVVAATNGFGEFGMLAKNDAKPGSGFYPQTSQIIVRDLGEENIDYNPERIFVDDSTLEDPIQVRPGDRVRSLTGIVDYTFSMYKLQPTIWDIKTLPSPRRDALSTRSGGMGDTVITTFNVENLFDLIDTPGKDDIGTGGAETEDALDLQLTKLALAIEVELGLPDIMVLQEVENQAIAQELGDRVNAASGTNYVARSFETSDGRGIEVAFLFDDDRVDLKDAYQLSGPDVEKWFGPTSPSPGREPLYGEFQIGNEVVHIVGNHFKSKGGDDPLYGVNWPPIRITEVQRKGQAQVVRDFVNGILDPDGDALVMVTGDLNDFQFSEPGEGPDHPVAIIAGDAGEVPLFNLIDLETDAERWTFVFDGNSQVLDHMLVSPALLEKVVGADILHFNTPINAAVEDDATTALAASDHDPLEGRFDMGASGKKK